MKEAVVSSCEKEFVIKAASEGKRLDGRGPYDFRNIEIRFSKDKGSCQVQLGKTIVLAQVSCELVQPKSSHPNEGLLYINAELSPMASPYFELGKQMELVTEINRLLERIFKDSKCLDLESLCIVAEEKVWSIKVDVHVLNHDGCLADCCSLAVLTSLMHFSRPDISMIGDEVVIHSLDEKDPLPLTLYHMPLLVTFAFYNEGEYLLVDPTDLEEKVMEGKMIVGINSYKELCALHLMGSVLLITEQIHRCTQIAAMHVNNIDRLIRDQIQKDNNKRKDGKKLGFSECINMNQLKSSWCPEKLFEINVEDTFLPDLSKQKITEKSVKIIEHEQGIVETIYTNSEPEIELLDINSDSSHSDIEVMKQITPPAKTIEQIELSGDSSEDEVIMLEPHFILETDKKYNSSRTSDNQADGRKWYSNKGW